MQSDYLLRYHAYFLFVIVNPITNLLLSFISRTGLKCGFLGQLGVGKRYFKPGLDPWNLLQPN